jgi:PleD family two-component response regulator
MSNFAGKLESNLDTLRQASPDARIILLARMLEEPKAIEMTFSRDRTKSLADDYFICPADKDIFGSNGKITAKSALTSQQIDPAKTAYTEQRIRELEKLATQDDLTGLKNRRYVREFLRQIIKRAKKEDVQVTLFVFDIDNFKHYNDTYGHSVGDMVLKQAAAMMKLCCRTHDIIGRIGGDEFAVIFWDCPVEWNRDGTEKTLKDERRQADAEHPHEALFMSERFRKAISSAELTFLGSEGKGELTISGGLASFPRDGLQVQELFEQADKAMLDAKRSGKNRIYLVGRPA